jgi:hemerythrin
MTKQRPMETNEYITWNSQYSVGNEIIDEQHKEWIRILNNFHDAVQKGQGQVILLETIQLFFEYTQYHFAEEEKLLKKYNYPLAYAHIEAHTQMIWTITHLYHDYGKNNILLSFKTLDILKDWLIKHILTLDKEFGNFIQLQKINTNDGN